MKTSQKIIQFFNPILFQARITLKPCYIYKINEHSQKGIWQGDFRIILKNPGIYIL